MKSLTKALRKNQTDAEKRLWYHLRNRQLAVFKFRRQHEIGHYIVDFVCLEIKLIVELDGSQHAEQIARDRQRTAFLQSLGFKVIRFWDNEVLTQTQNVLEAIHKALIDNPSPPPSPSRGEEKKHRAK
jgi:very-short-patch-repair endonuclease